MHESRALWNLELLFGLLPVKTLYHKKKKKKNVKIYDGQSDEILQVHAVSLVSTLQGQSFFFFYRAMSSIDSIS